MSAAAGQTDPARARLGGVQCLRALAALLVVASHLSHFENEAAPDALLPGWLYLGGSGVDLFFVISGFVMVYVTRGAFGRAQTAGAFLFNRIARIYPPLWLFTALAAAGFLMFGEASDWITPRVVALSALLWPGGDPQIVGVAWTLVHEVYFYLVFTLFLLGPARLLPLWLALWAGLIGLGELFGWRGAGPQAELVLHPLTLEFIMGCGVGLLTCSGRRRFAPAALLAGVAGFVAGWICLAALGPGGFPQLWGRTLIFGPAAALVVYGVAALEADHGWRAPRAGVLLGDWSYALYLSHSLVMSALAELWARHALQGGPLDNLLWMALAVSACIALAALTYYAYERPVLAAAAGLRKRLFGASALPPREGIAQRIW